MKKRVLIIFLSLLLACTVGGLGGCGGGDNENGLSYVLFDDNEGFLAVTGKPNTDFTTVIIPQTMGGITVNRIDYEAFSNCTSLSKVTIPSTVTSIFGKAFKGCTALAEIKLPSGLDSIGTEGFSGSGLKEVLLPDLTSLGLQSFALCNDLEYVKFSDSLSVLQNRMFVGCVKLETVLLPKNLKTLEQGVFENCLSLAQISFPSDLTSIGVRCFYACTALTAAELPMSLVDLGSNAFADCTSLATLTLPDSLQSIGAYAFNGCTALTSVTLPPLLQSIGTGAFLGCTSLKTVTIECEDEVISFDAFDFDNVPDGFSLNVPAGLVEDYKAAEGWSDFADYIKAIDNDQA